MIVTIVILACFLFELTMRQIAKGYRFVKDKWNIFDFVVSALEAGTWALAVQAANRVVLLRSFG